jgi:hypothetical protein
MKITVMIQTQDSNVTPKISEKSSENKNQVFETRTPENLENSDQLPRSWKILENFQDLKNYKKNSRLKKIFNQPRVNYPRPSKNYVTQHAGNPNTVCASANRRQARLRGAGSPKPFRGSPCNRTNTYRNNWPHGRNWIKPPSPDFTSNYCRRPCSSNKPKNGYTARHHECPIVGSRMGQSKPTRHGGRQWTPPIERVSPYKCKYHTRAHFAY